VRSSYLISSTGFPRVPPFFYPPRQQGPSLRLWRKVQTTSYISPSCLRPRSAGASTAVSVIVVLKLPSLSNRLRCHSFQPHSNLIQSLSRPPIPANLPTRRTLLPNASVTGCLRTLRHVRNRMTFFKELRRRSKASFRTNDSSAESNGTVPTTKSSSTLNSSYGASTPPPSVRPDASTSNVTTVKSNGENKAPPIPARPAAAPLHSNRNSVIVRHDPSHVPTCHL